TALAGKAFRLRFRVGSDVDTGAPGWDIDNVVFSGILGTPFPTLVADPGHCRAMVAPPAGDGNGKSAGDGDDPGSDDGRATDDGGCRTGAGAGTGVGAGAALWIGLLMVLRRRRRRA
ncbi:MAG: MYXO-CTERM sorting domain-containing protein, partial [Solirubrobacteraceae bacterium]